MAAGRRAKILRGVVFEGFEKEKQGIESRQGAEESGKRVEKVVGRVGRVEVWLFERWEGFWVVGGVGKVGRENMERK
jgi:hypothetical protein